MAALQEPMVSHAIDGKERRCAPSLPSRIPSLDGIRALAIGLVLLSHSMFSLRVHRGASLFFSERFGVFAGWFGGTGVNIFFVLSGFLITFLLLKEWDETGRIDLKDFYLRRAFRILPPFYLLLLTIFVLQRAHVLQLPTREIIYSGLFVFNYAPAGNTWISHTWSLSVEEQFYLMWPLILMMLGPGRSRRIALSLIAIVPVIRIATRLAFPPQHYLVSRMSMLAHTRIDMLMFGCALALFWTSQKFQRVARQFFMRGGMPFSLFVLFVVCPLLNLKWGESFMSVAGYTMTGLAVAACIYYFVENPKTILGKLLNLRPVAHLGMISYSVYLWQQLFLNEKNTTLSGMLPCSIVCAVLVAQFSYRCIERPALRLRDRLTNGRRHQTSAIQSSAPSNQNGIPAQAVNG
jgi:peptidoglycan/LPS O-acetylase OafA/YrhL